jgi:HemY protein
MAELEETESGDLGRAREWMSRAVHARRDPAWTADGLISERWMPVSPVSGRLDAFQWRDPLAALGGGSSVALVEAEANKERLSERFEPRLERPVPASAEKPVATPAPRDPWCRPRRSAPEPAPPRDAGGDCARVPEGCRQISDH